MRAPSLALFVSMAAAAGLIACGGGSAGETSDATGGNSGSTGGSSGGSGGGTPSSGGVSENEGGAPSLSGPIEQGDLLVLEFEGRKLSVDPENGGRIVSLSFEGEELLVQENENEAFGSTFWTSPQSAWDWPPPSVLDSEPYEASVKESSFSIVSGESDATGTPLVVTKGFSVDFAASAFVVLYTVENRGESSIELAGWEVTRVPSGGLTFFPTGDAEKKAPDHPLLTLQHAGGVSYFDQEAWTSGQGQKVNADGKGGYLAHAAGSVLLVKSFSDVPLAAQHEEEGEIEIYADGADAFVEIENQSALANLAPGQKLTYSVRYVVGAIPSSVEVSPGSSSLVAFAESFL